MPTALGTASWLVSWLLSFLWRCVASYTRRDTARRRLAVFMGFLYQIPLLNAMNIGSSSLLFYIPLVLNHKWLYNESNIISGKLKWMMHEQVNRLMIYNGVEWTKWYIMCGYYSAYSSHTLNSSQIAAPSVLCKMKPCTSLYWRAQRSEILYKCSEWMVHASEEIEVYPWTAAKKIIDYDI